MDGTFLCHSGKMAVIIAAGFFCNRFALTGWKLSARAALATGAGLNKIQIRTILPDFS